MKKLSVHSPYREVIESCHTDKMAKAKQLFVPGETALGTLLYLKPESNKGRSYQYDRRKGCTLRSLFPARRRNLKIQATTTINLLSV